MNSISIVFPAYNEQANIVAAVDEAASFALKVFDANYEIIVVDDGSRDQTAAVVLKIARADKKVRLIRHKINLGYGAAVWSGLKAARKELIFFTDSDLQFKISELSKFLKEIKNCDAVIGYRARRSEGGIRKINMIGWRILTRLLLGIKPRDIDCAFKLFRREALEGIEIKSKGAAFSAELLYRLKARSLSIRELPVAHFPRRAGCPTGARLGVIKRAFVELWAVYKSRGRV